MSPATTPGYNSGSGIEQNTGNITRPNAAQLIATEVVDFGVRLYERAPGGTLREVFPCRRDVNGTPEAGQSTKTPPFSYAASTRAPGAHPHGGLALLLGNIDCGYPCRGGNFHPHPHPARFHHDPDLRGRRCRPIPRSDMVEHC
ncbi:hypothetical protein [Geminisphaera colitermitum]|uniref:hypothetical protein n=1 Tax=Geminisphaera colitermitum TaxID=1148786 RepID=UPI000158CF2C|nr:hypothetical protein [Geminisphaera colitermitum]